jgi:hypothetical protein
MSRHSDRFVNDIVRPQKSSFDLGALPCASTSLRFVHAAFGGSAFHGHFL